MASSVDLLRLQANWCWSKSGGRLVWTCFSTSLSKHFINIWGKCTWHVVDFFGTGMMTEDFRQVGTFLRVSDWLKMSVNTAQSWSDRQEVVIDDGWIALDDMDN